RYRLELKLFSTGIQGQSHGRARPKSRAKKIIWVRTPIRAARRHRFVCRELMRTDSDLLFERRRFAVDHDRVLVLTHEPSIEKRKNEPFSFPSHRSYAL